MFKYYFNGGFGFYLPGNAKEVLKERESYNRLSFQANYKDDLFVRLFFDNGVINYEKDALLGGVTTEIRNKRNANFIGLDDGYSKSFIRFTPSLCIGAGLFKMDVPKIGFKIPLQ